MLRCLLFHRAAFPYAAITQRLYWSSIGFRPPANSTGGPKSSGGRSDGAGAPAPSGQPSAALRIGLPVAVAVGGALAFALVGLVCYVFVIAPRGARARSKRYRAAQPPGAGPATTLIMTDVQVCAWGLPTRLQHCYEDGASNGAMYITRSCAVAGVRGHALSLCLNLPGAGGGSGGRGAPCGGCAGCKRAAQEQQQQQQQQQQ